MLSRNSRNRSSWKLFIIVCVCVTSGLLIFQIGFLKGQDCALQGIDLCESSHTAIKSAAIGNEHNNKRRSGTYKNALLNTKKTAKKEGVHQKVEPIPAAVISSHDEQQPDPHIQSNNATPRHSYVHIREADSPVMGDFTCGGTVVPKCCAFYVTSPPDGKKICDAFVDFCKGFVMTTLSTNLNRIQYMVYLKKELKGVMTNYITDMYVKSTYVNEMRWSGQNGDSQQFVDGPAQHREIPMIKSDILK